MDRGRSPRRGPILRLKAALVVSLLAHAALLLVVPQRSPLLAPTAVLQARLQDRPGPTTPLPTSPTTSPTTSPAPKPAPQPPPAANAQAAAARQHSAGQPKPPQTDAAATRPIGNKAHGEQLNPPQAAAPAASAQLNLAAVLDEARAYGAEVQRTRPAGSDLAGHYSGSFGGADEGSFQFELDHAGRISGFAQSRLHGVSLPISGHLSADGLVHMRGTGLAGEVRFSGQLHWVTRTVTGSWYLPRLGSGHFSGRQDARQPWQPNPAGVSLRGD